MSSLAFYGRHMGPGLIPNESQGYEMIDQLRTAISNKRRQKGKLKSLPEVPLDRTPFPHRARAISLLQKPSSHDGWEFIHPKVSPPPPSNGGSRLRSPVRVKKRPSQRYARDVRTIATLIAKTSRMRVAAGQARNELRQKRAELSAVESRWFRTLQLFMSSLDPNLIRSTTAELVQQLATLSDEAREARESFEVHELTYNDQEADLEMEDYQFQSKADRFARKYVKTLANTNISTGSESNLPSDSDSGSDSGSGSKSASPSDSLSTNSKMGMTMLGSNEDLRGVHNNTSAAMNAYTEKLKELRMLSEQLEDFEQDEARFDQVAQWRDIGEISQPEESAVLRAKFENEYANLRQKISSVREEAARLSREAFPDQDTRWRHADPIDLDMFQYPQPRRPLLFPLSQGDPKQNKLEAESNFLLVGFTSPRDRVNRWLLHVLRSALLEVAQYEIILEDKLKAGDATANTQLEREHSIADEAISTWPLDEAGRGSTLSMFATETTISTPQTAPASPVKPQQRPMVHRHAKSDDPPPTHFELAVSPKSRLKSEIDKTALWSSAKTDGPLGWRKFFGATADFLISPFRQVS